MYQTISNTQVVKLQWGMAWFLASRKRIDALSRRSPIASKLAVGTWLVRPRPTNRPDLLPSQSLGRGHAEPCSGQKHVTFLLPNIGSVDEFHPDLAKNAHRNPIQGQHEEVVECKGLRLGVPLAPGPVVRSAAYSPLIVGTNNCFQYV